MKKRGKGWNWKRVQEAQSTHLGLKALRSVPLSCFVIDASIATFAGAQVLREHRKMLAEAAHAKP
jgi:hypothetical protein